ncbi:hypothetical protein B4N89_16165 [Embleya scabrispora]|uniref:Uncharacterized protein n=1 Tax=Embleya scabrispora TaxID=159449 RepID=A0A1T3NZX4_9ACTN|nr:DUF6086 family protein [Embleya scabrispora]OPC82262.1 hypothetical protein B4N89_16165 [Embleya scabrispora]
MSCFFDIAGETVWNPSLSAGKLFASAVGNLAQLYGLDSGIVDDSSDTYEIDREVFLSFAERIFDRYFATSHPEYRLLLRGVLVMSLALLERGGVILRATTAEQAELLGEVHERSVRLPV